VESTNLGKPLDKTFGYPVKKSTDLMIIFCMFSHRIGVIAGRHSSDGIATRYRLNGLGIEIFLSRPELSRGPPSPLYNRYRDIPKSKAATA